MFPHNLTNEELAAQHTWNSWNWRYRLGGIEATWHVYFTKSGDPNIYCRKATPDDLHPVEPPLVCLHYHCEKCNEPREGKIIDVRSSDE